ncbi:unnamed protein product [Moneuplotes crassus]|uniref:Uncharacterized protein n=1 Tax=Euplotes crassus TaxID=5936 RepID=A0AAD1UKX9_EUPCR|nr:unnamed protein product [Moneuplotes crassus]
MESYSIENIQSFFERNNIQARIKANYMNKKNMCINIKTIGLDKKDLFESCAPIYTCNDISNIFSPSHKKTKKKRKTSVNKRKFKKTIRKSEISRKCRKSEDRKHTLPKGIQRVFDEVKFNNSEIPPIRVKKYNTPVVRESTRASSVVNILPNVARSSIIKAQDPNIELATIKGVSKQLNKSIFPCPLGTYKTEDSRKYRRDVNSSLKVTSNFGDIIYENYEISSRIKNHPIINHRRVPGLEKIRSLGSDIRNRSLRDKRHSVPMKISMNPHVNYKGISSIIKKQPKSNKNKEKKEMTEFDDLGPWESDNHSYSDF